MKHFALRLCLLSLLLIVSASAACADDARAAFKAGVVKTIPKETLFLHVRFPGGHGSRINLRDGRILDIYGAHKQISADGGETWGKPQPLLDSTGSVLTGAGSPRRLKSGGIGIICNGSGYSLWFSRSGDEGKTWSKPTRISEPGIQTMAMHDSTVVTSSGRIVVPAYTWVGGGAGGLVPEGAGKCVALVGDDYQPIGGHDYENAMDFAFVYFSDDEGKTWQRNTDGSMIVTLDYSAGGHYSCEESAIAEVSPNHLLLIHRTPMGRFYQSWSSDDGTTWSQPEPTALASARAPACLKRIPGSNDLLLVWNQTSAEEIEMGFKRNRLSAAISQDGGLTWKYHKNVRSREGDRTTHVEVSPIKYYRARRLANKRQNAYRPYSTYPSVSFWKDRVIITFFAPDPDTPRDKGRICMGLPLSWFYGN